jgi:plasmid stabilization system protein ParE
VANVIWLPEALEDVVRLYDFLAERNPEAARRAAVAIKAQARHLEQSPDSGLPMNDGERRQVFLAFGAGAYVLRYRRNREDDVVIVRVWHSRETRG